MATRFYLPYSGTPSVSPAYNSAWEDTSIVARLNAVTTRISSTMTTVSFSDADATNKDILYRQYVSEPLAAQTIAAQTLKFQIRGIESGTGNNMYTAISVRTWNGSTFQNIISGVLRDATELTTSLVNRQYSVTTTAVTIAAGDRIIIEIGQGGDPATNQSHGGGLSIGDNSTTDLGENNTDTAAYNPWVEFANTLSFGAAPDALVAKDITVGVPTIDKATIGQTHVLTAKDISTIPTVDKAVIGQIHALIAADIFTAAPTIDKATLAEASGEDTLTAKDITSGIPTIDKAVIGQVHALTAKDITTNPPTLDKATISQVHALTARDITSGIPTLDKATIGQTHVLVAKDISTIPTVDRAIIGQTHVLVAIDIFTAAPTIDKATLSESAAGTDNLTAKDLLSGSPTIDHATIGQIHNLISRDIFSGSPTIDKSIIGVIHNLVASDITSGIPTIDKAVVGQIHNLVASDISTIPTIDQAIMGQIHALVSSDLYSGIPTLDKAILVEVVALVARDITAGIPTLDQSTIGQIHNLIGQDISTIPTIEKSIIGQIHALLSQDLYAGVPAIDLARLFINIYVAIGDLPLRDFDLSFEHEREKHFVLKPRDSFHIELKRREDRIELESRRNDFTWTKD